MMKKYILIMLFTLAGLAGMAQTNELLPGDAEPLTNQLYLSPSDSTVWAADPFSGLAIEVGTWFKVDSLFGLTYLTPNIFSGNSLSDYRKIQLALDLSIDLGKTLHIGYNEDRDANVWLIDSAVMLRSGTDIEIVSSKLKLTDQARDNIFRSENVGFGITDPYENPVTSIRIKGVGSAILEGADNPRATGDSGKTLSLDPTENSNLTYGSDAFDPGEKQTGDWRNIGILLGYASDVEITGLTMNMLHSYCMSLERCHDVSISNIVLNNPVKRVVEGDTTWCKNTDGINVRFSGQNVVIRDIYGHTGDDMVALTVLASGSTPAGSYSSVMVTGNIYDPDIDDIYNVSVDNVQGYTYTNLVRLLNGAGTNMYNINVSNITDISNTSDSLYVPTTSGGDRSCIAIGSTISSSWGAADLGSCYNISINNIKSYRYDYGIKVGGSLSESFIRNVNKQNNNGIPAFYVESTSNGTRNVYLDGLNNSNDSLWYSSVSNGINDITHLVSSEISDSLSITDLNKIMANGSTTNYPLTISTSMGGTENLIYASDSNYPSYSYRVNNRGEFFYRIRNSSGDLIGRVVGRSATDKMFFELEAADTEGNFDGSSGLYVDSDQSLNFKIRNKDSTTYSDGVILSLNRPDSIVYAPSSTLGKLNSGGGRSLITKEWATSSLVNKTTSQTNINGDKSWTGQFLISPSTTVYPPNTANSIALSRTVSGAFIRIDNPSGATGAQIRGYSVNGVQADFNEGAVLAPQYRLSSLNTPPASSTATGTAGEIRFGTDGRIYICTSTNTWIRSEPLTTWP